MNKQDEYRKGQIDLFNRLWDVFNSTPDLEEGLLSLFRELNKLRDELSEENL